MAESAELHLRHDTISIAAAADRGGQLAPEHQTCPHCVRLYEDLVLLAGLAPMSAAPPRTRDFRLTAADAAHLRELSWTGWWRVIGSSRDRVTRPIAVTLTSLGLVGIVLTSVPALNMGAGAERELIDIQSGEDTGTGLASGEPTVPTGDPALTPGPTPTSDVDPPMLALSATFVAAGGALMILRWTMRRRVGVP